MDVWPHTCTFAELLTAARQRLNLNHQDPVTATTDIQVLASNLLNGYMHSDQLVAFTVFEPDFVDKVSVRPVASPWARLQAERMRTVTTFRHGRYVLEPYEQFMIRLLDGQHDVAAVVDELIAGPVASGELKLEKEDQPITDPAELREQLHEGVEKTLVAFAAAPLLSA